MKRMTRRKFLVLAIASAAVVPLGKVLRVDAARVFPTTASRPSPGYGGGSFGLGAYGQATARVNEPA